MSKIELFSSLFREAEIEIGTRDLDVLVLNSLKDTIKNCKLTTVRDFCKQFEKLVDITSKTEPRFGVIIYHLKKLHDSYKKELVTKKKSWKQCALKHINAFLSEVKNKKIRILKNADKLKVKNKTILIHDHSHTVQDVLKHLKQNKNHFKIIVAEQDFDKTHSNIEMLHANQIPFQVVPSYMLSHIHDEIDMAFFGAVTLKDTMQFVMSPGTHSIISEIHLTKKPVYVFLDTTKFSLWKSKRRKEGVFIHKHEREHHAKEIKYERIKYSHDRVETDLFEKIITEEGIFTPKELKKFFDMRLKQH